MAETLVLTISAEAYARLRERAEQLGQPVEKVSAEIIEAAIGVTPRAEILRQSLERAGRIRSHDAKRKSPDAAVADLEEIRSALGRWEGPLLSEIVIEQRGPKL